MSEREKAQALLAGIPDNKIMFVISFLQELSDGAVEAPDEFDLEMLEEARRENDGQRVSFDDVVKEFGITL